MRHRTLTAATLIFALVLGASPATAAPTTAAGSPNVLQDAGVDDLTVARGEWDKVWGKALALFASDTGKVATAERTALETLKASADIAVTVPALTNLTASAKATVAAGEKKVKEYFALADARKRFAAERATALKLIPQLEKLGWGMSGYKTYIAELKQAVDGVITSAGVEIRTASVKAMNATMTRIIADEKAKAAKQAKARAAELKKNMKKAWFRDARAKLNKVGGKNIYLKTFNGKCGKVKAHGCAWSDDQIGLTAAYKKYSKKQRWWIIWHEFAHQKQYDHWTKMQNSKQFKKLFKKNVEKLANCMAAVKGYSVTKCTKAQKKYAKAAWKGKF